MSSIGDLLFLIYPAVCAGCSGELMKGEDTICTHCRFHLPRTNYHQYPSNPVCKHFWGRVQVEAAASCYHFNRGGIVQNLIHRLKYHERPDIGVVLGKIYGHQLKKEIPYNKCDLIIPVPLHPKRQKERGYNQSLCFAEGLSAAMNIPVDTSLLLRAEASSTQTRKNRFERYENMKNIFLLKNENKLINKRILLVDDVITTGATLEGCISILNKVNGLRICVASIASAD